METTGRDLGDFVELYKGYRLEVRTEQVWIGEKAHYRVLQGDAELIGWRLVHVDGVWLSERRVVDQVLALARAAVDRELGGARAA
ncbi:hypothetical protein [Burkholderia glumae]|uniref:Tyrosinase cofactor n=1 Tax=Burkholderia glumae TaxID=337 RepID=A0AAQ0BUS7_BURGL|nr:hypothetical protein [Burkholderia glumae]ACR29048.1 Hypothetical protein bglu_1g19380 [Burkholderia glumae BGR1]AJY64988.1 hypothetical protein KS03_2788 [Burkholderia glumae LMG 2196 = ATCC 33617]KHJ61797.1 hypothetical protein NCPPB3923_16920 [Burkholderia glumae]MCM2483120.1 tyrosinase cofactor [Burkholderia glumae]MCM2493430.1 tyrosinase cofactor [Burkholderia glumae]